MQQEIIMNDNLRYFIYCRKSSEDSNRQIASIGDQIDALTIVVRRESLNIVRDPFIEERSAKDPGRPIFNEMLKRIEKGEANALFCWDIDRLSRNPIDNGRLQWMLQKKVINIIKTPSRSFYPEDAGLLLSIEGARATDYVVRLSKIVNERMFARAQKGWRPIGKQPIGYLNQGIVKGNKIIVPDPERFKIVRKMWKLFLTGGYSVSEIREMANNEWGLRTRKQFRLGGKPLSLSTIYRIFKDYFYAGYYSWKDPNTGELIKLQGKHEAMISEKEFWYAQVLLGKKGKPQPKTREFAYTGFMKCGECESTITAEEKQYMRCSVCLHKFSYTKLTSCPKCFTNISKMKHPQIFNYIYYHCTKKKNRQCSQKAIRLEELEAQIENVLKGITINAKMVNLLHEYQRGNQINTIKEELAIKESLQSAFDDCEKQLSHLKREFLSPLNSNHELFTEKEFIAQKQEINKERDSIERKINEIGGKEGEIQATLLQLFNFCAYAKSHFVNGDLKTKRIIFGSLGSKHTLIDKKLITVRHNPYLLIENALKDQLMNLPPLETENSLILQEPISIYMPVIIMMCSAWEAIRIWLLENQDFNVPNLNKEVDSS